jgi:hypothetical protein
MEVLTAYVRRNAPLTSGDAEDFRQNAKPPRTDIQAILTVLGRRERSYRRERNRRLDVTQTDLRLLTSAAHTCNGPTSVRPNYTRPVLVRPAERSTFSDAQLQDANFTSAH